MQYADAVRECMASLDVSTARRAWKYLFPAYPEPGTDADILKMLHAARTASDHMTLGARAYSHRWLTERGLPSLLPDGLKPKADRLYPASVGSVGISVNSRYPAIRESVSSVMEGAVLDCYANGDKDPAIVKRQMFEARRRELLGLGLTRSS